MTHEIIHRPFVVYRVRPSHILKADLLAYPLRGPFPTDTVAMYYVGTYDAADGAEAAGLARRDGK